MRRLPRRSRQVNGWSPMRDSATATLARRGLRGRLRAAVGPALQPPPAARLRDRALSTFARGAELAIVGLGYLVLPVWPLVAAAIARDAAYLRRYPSALRQAARHIHGILRGRSIARFLLSRIGRRSRQREQIAGACTHCGNCCLYRGCMFLTNDALGQSRCRIYGARVWKLLACGDYPINGEEIELFACPSFVAHPASLQERIVIPIASVGFSQAPSPALDSPPVGRADGAPVRRARDG